MKQLKISEESEKLKYENIWRNAGGGSAIIKIAEA